MDASTEYRHAIKAVAAALIGWRVIYLGPNMPAEDIARAAKLGSARAVALSIVYPADESRVGQEIAKPGRPLGKGVVLLVGGQGAGGFKPVLDSSGAVHLTDLALFQRKLESIRTATSVDRWTWSGQPRVYHLIYQP